MYTKVKTKQEIVAMRQSGRILASILKTLSHSIAAGMSTKNLSEIAKKN